MQQALCLVGWLPVFGLACHVFVACILLLLQIPPPGVLFDRWECYYLVQLNVTANGSNNSSLNGANSGTAVPHETLGALPLPLTGVNGFTLGPNDVITCVAVYRLDLPRLALLSDYFPAKYIGHAAGQLPTNGKCSPVLPQRLNATCNITIVSPGAGFCVVNGNSSGTIVTGSAPAPSSLQVCINVTM
jgi:hypothetical protein